MSVSEKATHGLSCRSSKGRWNRHSDANNILCRALTSAGYPSILEPTGLSRIDNKRPDGMTRVPWEKGLSLLWDFTCVDSLAPSRIVSKHAADAQEEKKRATYSVG